MELKKYTLGQLIDVTRGASLGGEHYATKGDYIRLTCGNFDYRNNCFKENDSKDNIYYTGNFKKVFLLDKGDIITPLTEQAIGLLGSTAIIPESGKYIQSQDIAKIICNENLLDKKYAFYLISSKGVKQQLSAAAQQTKIRHTSPDKIKACTVWIPSLPTQRKVAELLSALDQKIALNRNINQQLEQLARTIYNYYFLQFQTPPHTTQLTYNPILKKNIPIGWEVKKLFDAVDVLYGFPFNSALFTEKETDTPIVRIRDIADKSTSTYTTEPISEKYKLQKGDVLIGMDGNFHMCIWGNENAYLNQRCVRLRPLAESPISSYQILFSLQPYIKAKESSIKGSTVGHLSDKDLKELYLLQPTIQETDIKEQLNTILDIAVNNQTEITTLTTYRDALLPLLMNGQVEVKV